MIREIFEAFLKLRAGISAKETTRTDGLVAERDRALAAVAVAEAEEEKQRKLKILWQEYAGQLIYQLRVNGLEPATPLGGLDETHPTTPK